MIKKNDNKYLIWIDLEMTGLKPEIHRIIEIATIITDIKLNIIAEGPVIPIYQKEKYIFMMDEWNRKTHKKTGLIKRIQNSTYNESKAENETIFFLKKWLPIKSSPICGNSIYQDRKFLNKYMPTLENYFHYRCIDVSTIKELVKRWHPKILKKKKKNHTALSDIYDSITELRFYKKNFFEI